MITRFKVVSGVCGLLVAASIAPAETVMWEQIESAFSANDMSPDGRFIVGEVDQDGNSFPDGTYIWDRQTDTFTILPPQGLIAVAISDDGQVVLGEMLDPDDFTPPISTVAAMWTQKTGWFSLGYLPDSLECPSRSNGYELSADGSVAVGLSWDGCSGRGFLWTADTGMIELEALANGGNRASVVSSDGTVIAGFAQGSGSRTPAAWDGATTDGVLLDPPNGDHVGEIQGISDDGTILLGTYEVGLPETKAVKWTQDGKGVWNWQQIGNGALNSVWSGIAMDVAQNGTIVGFDIRLGNRRAWIQPGGEGDLVQLSSFITQNGGTIPGGTSLEVCQAISNDGSVIIGHSFGAGAWLVTITASCAADLDDSGDVGFDDFTELLASWGPCAGCAADLDGNGEVGFDDFTLLLASWGPCE